MLPWYRDVHSITTNVDSDQAVISLSFARSLSKRRVHRADDSEIRFDQFCRKETVKSPPQPLTHGRFPQPKHYFGRRLQPFFSGSLAHRWAGGRVRLSH